MTEPIRLGFIGAGIISRTAYAPELNLPQLRDRFTVVAICSRTEESARDLAGLFPNAPDITTDEAALLARQDLEAVAVVLPIPLLPGSVERALGAGKHVISEKPVAADAATGRRLIERWRANHSGQVWMVAENWRYEEAFLRAAEIIRRGDIGRPLMAHWAMYSAMLPGNKWYGTPWRRKGDVPGGFLLDGGVHQVAALRLILGEVKSVSATVVQHREDLPPSDTVVAVLCFIDGAVGAFARTYAVEAHWHRGLHIAGGRGALRVDRGEIELTVRDSPRQVLTTKRNNGGPDQLRAFAEAIRASAPHRNTPQEALRDVAVIEAMFRASAEGRAKAPEY
jgi:predicted dehydrogenase